MQCPVCKETIKDGAIKCRFCGYIIDKEAYAKLSGGDGTEKRNLKKIKKSVSNTFFAFFNKIKLWIKEHNLLTAIITSVVIIEIILASFLLKKQDFFSGVYISKIRGNSCKISIKRLPDRKGKKDYKTRLYINSREYYKVITYWHYNKRTKKEYLTLKNRRGSSFNWDLYYNTRLYLTPADKTHLYLFDSRWRYITKFRLISKSRKSKNIEIKLFIISNIILLIVLTIILLWEKIIKILSKAGKGIYKVTKNIITTIGNGIKAMLKGITTVLKKINYVKVGIVIGIIGILAAIGYIGTTIEWSKPPVMEISLAEQEVVPGNPLNDELIKINKKLKQEPDNTKLNLKKSEILSKKHNSKATIIAADKVIENNNKSAKAYYLLGEGYFNQEKYGLARKNYEKSISINKNYADAYMGLAKCYLIEKKYNKAEKEYLKVISLDKKNAEAYHNLGIILAKKNKYSEAIKYLEKAISLKPDMKKAYLNIGILYEKTGNKEKAIKNYEKYLEYEPGNWQVSKWVNELKGVE